MPALPAFTGQLRRDIGTDGTVSFHVYPCAQPIIMPNGRIEVGHYNELPQQ
jgi:hypothetical protein